MVNYVQNSVENQPAMGYPGMVGDGWAGTDIKTGFAPVGGLSAGLAVSTQASDVVVSPTTSASVTATPAGVVTTTNTLEGGSAALYADGVATPVMRKGRVFVVWEGAVTTALINTTPFVRFTAAGAEQLGAFRVDADGGDAVAAPWARIVAVDTVFGQVEVDVLLP